MAQSLAVSSWVMQIHGLLKVDIDSKSADPGFVSVQMLVKEANGEYTMLLASEHWGPCGKMDNEAAPEVLYTKAEQNTFGSKTRICCLEANVQWQQQEVSDSQISNRCDQKNKQDDKSKKPKVPCTSKQAWKAKPPNFGEMEIKEVDGKT